MRLAPNRLLALILAVTVNEGSAQESVQDLADEWTAAYNTHDIAALGALYGEDARLMMNGAPTIVGRKAIEEFWSREFIADSPLMLFAVTHKIFGVDMILVHGDYQVIDRDSGARLGAGRFAHIWMLNEDGEWRLDRDLWKERVEAYE
jgi:uncharacterized protein (TIGR02246 family)